MGVSQLLRKFLKVSKTVFVFWNWLNWTHSVKVNRWGHFYFKGGIYAETIFRHELTLRHSGFLLFRNKICPEVFKISKSVLQYKKSSSISYLAIYQKKYSQHHHVSFCLYLYSFSTNLLVQFPDYLAYLIINDSVFSVSLTQISGWPNS